MRPRKSNKMKQFCLYKLGIVALLLALQAPGLSQAGDLILPEGTRIALQLNNQLSTKSSNEGESFTAYVIAPVMLQERIIIPKGSIVNGSISRIIRAGRFKGKAGMILLFQSISIPGRGLTPITASTIKINSEGNNTIRSEGKIEGEGSVGSDVQKTLTPGLAGAGIGAIAGGARGAGIGAGAGVAIGLATVFTTRGKDLELRRGETLEISLDRSLSMAE
jgi:hypothetical protein